MAKQLSKEQVLLLNNLMYMQNKEPLTEMIGKDNLTVGEVVSSIKVNNLKADQDYGSLMTGNDWKDIVTAVKKDPQLMNMKIVSTHVDRGPGSGGGASAVFVDPSTKEAIVTFKGTGENEWKDNFVGGGRTDGLDGVSTRQQENALEWYRSLDLDQYSSVTVTGHSKGGNKAKYVTVMDNSVERCLSFDGQGFSDEFINKYRDQIAASQGKISNNNVDSDYVNLLLNDIGTTHFYKGYGYGKGGFLENHCPNTFLNFNPDGTFSLTGSERDPRMAQLDEFLNSYLRTLSPEDKQKTLAMIGEMAQAASNKASVNELLDILLDGKNTDYAANLAAYLLKYKKEHPEIVGTTTDVLNSIGMENISKIIDIADQITNWSGFDELMKALGWASGHLPKFVYDKLREFLKGKGIDLSDEELEKLLGMLKTMSDDMETVNVDGDGSDLVVTSAAHHPSDEKNKVCHFSVQNENIGNMHTGFEDTYNKLATCSDELKAVCKNLDGSFFIQKLKLAFLQVELEREMKQALQMKQVLGQVHYEYKTSEEKLVNAAHL